MKHGREDLHPAPHVSVVDPVQEIFHPLDQYDGVCTNMLDCAYINSVGELTWHRDLIPEDEI